MTWSEELRQAHLDLSPEDLAFRERACQDPAMLRRSTFASLSEDRPLLRFPQQPWPTLVSRAKLAELERASAGIANLIRAVPRRLLGGKGQRISDFYGVGSAQLADLVMMEPNGFATSIGRGDFIHTRNGFQCLEFNFSSNLGGWETGFLGNLHKSIPATAACLAQAASSFSYTDTTQTALAYLIADARAKKLIQGGELVLFLTILEEGLPNWSTFLGHLNRELAAACEKEGRGLKGKVLAGPYSHLTRDGATLACNGTRVHTILEMSHDATTPLAFRAFKAGTVSLFNGPARPILGNKRNLALLSESAHSDVWTAEEREILDRHLPWTRLVQTGPVVYEGREIELVELLRAEPARFVLKEGNSYGGKGVFLGRSLAADAWEEAIQHALADGTFIVQEYQDSLPYLFQCGDDGCAPHNVIWGSFLFGQTYGGAFLRVQPVAEEGPVNLSVAATEGIVLEV